MGDIFTDVDKMDVEKMLNGDFSETENTDQKTNNAKTKKHKQPKTGKPEERLLLPPFYPERYPHTHFNVGSDPAFNAEAYLHIMRDWAKSLTILMDKLAIDCIKKDIDAIREMQKLLDKLNIFIDQLTAHLQNYYLSLNGAMEKLHMFNETVTKFIETCRPKFEALFECIENRLKVHDDILKSHDKRLDTAEERLDGHDKRLDELEEAVNKINNNLTEIYNYIDNIYEALEGLLSSNVNTRKLTYNTDYTVDFYNYWRLYDSSQGCPEIYLIQTKLTTPEATYYSDEYAMLTHEGTDIINDFVYNSSTIHNSDAPQFRHSSSLEEVPQSRIYKVHFNNSKLTTPTSWWQEGNNVFNMLCSNYAHVSWGVEVYLTAEANQELTASLVSIADGWNRQYTYYISQGETDELSFWVPNSQLHAVYYYEE